MAKVLDAYTATAVDALCEAIVPGSTRVGPSIYLDAVLARMDEAERTAALNAIRTLADAMKDDPHALAERVFTPEFLQVRALVIEAYYSDFVAPGRDVDGAWSEIDFNSPLATRLRKDWSYLGVEG